MAGASGCCSVIISLFEMMIEIGVLTEICESWASGSWAADSFRTLPASISYHDWVLRSETSPRGMYVQSHARLRQREVHCAKYKMRLVNRYS